MEFGDTWSDFIGDLEAVVRATRDKATNVEQIRPIVGRFIERERAAPVIAAKFKRPHPESYAQYLLYKSQDNAVCVVSVVWLPGQFAPIHSHETWGVIGVLQNHERETTYQRVDDGSRDGYAELRELDSRILGPGDITTVCPPNDIHRAGNAGSDTAISLHVYGGDIGTQTRRVFDVERRTVAPFVSGYARPE